PAPPSRSGASAAGTPARTSSSQKRAWKRAFSRFVPPDSLPGPQRESSSRSATSVTSCSPMSRTRPVSSVVVSSTVKSMSAVLAGGGGGSGGGRDARRRRQSETGCGDDVALHLVGAAAEGEDERRAVEALDAAVQS